MRYLVTCVTFLSVACCKLQSEVGHHLVSCAFFYQFCHSVGCMIMLSVMYYSVSCALPHQLCITRSVVYFSVSCALLDQLCITQSVVSHSVSCVTLSQLDDNSVSCLLLCPQVSSILSFPFLFLKHFQTSPSCRLLN